MSVSIFCPHCHKHTALSIAQTEYEFNYRKYETSAIWDDRNGGQWWIGICNNSHCQQPVLVLNDGSVIYPYPLPSMTDERIPDPMRRDLIEAKICFSVDAYRACSVMARRAIQNACINKGAKEKDVLATQINELFNKGVITKDIKDWADVVRNVGNDAAHPNNEILEKEDADDILELAEQMLQVLYVAPAIANSRKEVRDKKK